MAELESVLNMHGIRLRRPPGSAAEKQEPPEPQHACRILPLPTRVYPAASASAATNGKLPPRRPFVILSFPFDSPFVPASAKQPTPPPLPVNDNRDDDDENDSATVPQDIATIILSRCTLVRSVLELWGRATSLEECALATQRWARPDVEAASNDDNQNHQAPQAAATTGSTVYRNNSQPHQSWKLTVHTLGSKYTPEEQNAMRRLFTDLLPGRIQMVEPDHEFVLIREVELDAHGGALYPRHAHTPGQLVPENDARPPLACYFGRALAGCRSVHRMGGKMPEYNLKQRKYLGPTSMDAELSFIMTNLGQVGKGRIAFDPFVGTGSILLSCAVQGAYCIGTDIDIRVLRGRGRDENIWTNFRQFLDCPDPS